MVKLENNSNPGYEKRDVNVKKLVLWGIVGIVIVVISLVAIREYFLITKEDYYYRAVEKPRSRELMELRERETKELNSYELLDEEKGIYRIPIKRAMELIVEEESKLN
jgi:beta-lactamase regulating signal transducer with metallopeptidase domain